MSSPSEKLPLGLMVRLVGGPRFRGVGGRRRALCRRLAMLCGASTSSSSHPVAYFYLRATTPITCDPAHVNPNQVSRGVHRVRRAQRAVTILAAQR